MEALFYNYTVQDAEQRRADLRQAMHAFLADPTSRAAVQLIGLFVRIPTPSTITATRTTAKSSLSSSDALQPSATASSTPRRQSSAQKLAWCALETDRRLRQAAEDAAALNRGIVHDMAADDDGVRQHRSKSGSNSKTNPPRPLPPRRAATVVVVVVAYLAPQAREDLTVYESWQRCAEPCAPTENTTAQISRTTRRLSPLRRASFLALSLGAAPLLLSWSERPTHCYLGRLLLPHQTLLFDLSWCVTASLTSGVEMRKQGQGAGAGGSRVTLQVMLDLFTQDVLPCVHFPKGESRSAFWLAYSSLMASLHPRVFRAEDGDLALAASAPSPLYDSREGEHARPNAEAFGKTYRLLRQVFAALFHGHGGSAAGTAVVPGRTQATRVVLSYGGPLSALKRQLIHVGSRNAAVGATPRAVEAALLRTRSLVDVYALFGVLAGQDRSDFYAAAAGFVRTATRRASTAAAGSISTTDDARQAVESALVRVQTGGNASAAPTADADPNAFVEIGARALARRRLKLERQRLGKLRPHLRPRERLARARKHKVAVAKRQAAAKKSTADTTKAKPVAGEKRPAEEAEEKDGAPRKGSAAPAKRKRRTEITVLPAAVQPSSAKESLSWSVDLG